MRPVNTLFSLAHSRSVIDGVLQSSAPYDHFVKLSVWQRDQYGNHTLQQPDKIVVRSAHTIYPYSLGSVSCSKADTYALSRKSRLLEENQQPRGQPRDR